MLKKAEQVNAYIELLLRYNATHNLLKRNTKQEIIDNLKLGDAVSIEEELVDDFVKLYFSNHNNDALV